MDAVTEDGRLTKRLVVVGRYKTAPNNVRTSTGEIHYYTPPEQVNSKMSDLIDWYRDQEARGEHPIVVAATFHYRFVRIHPFDDGNGRMARLLMNLILIRHGYTLAIIAREGRSRYIQEIEDVAKTEDLSRFIELIASCCEYTLKLHLRAARGESIEDAEDINREIAIFKQSMVGRARSGRSVGGRRLVEHVVLPLERYCKDKLDMLAPDVCPQVSDTGGARISGTGTDGTAFSVSNELRLSGQPEYPTSAVPDDVANLDATLSFILSDCHVAGRRVSFRIDIAGRHTADEGTWTFAAESYGDLARAQSYHERHNSHDLEELKGQFNEMIRWIMKVLAQATGSGSGGARTGSGSRDAEVRAASERGGRNGNVLGRLRLSMRRLLG